MAAYNITDNCRAGAFVGVEGRTDIVLRYNFIGVAAEYSAGKISVGGSYAIFDRNGLSSPRRAAKLALDYDVNDRLTLGVDLNANVGSTGTDFTFFGVTGTYAMNDMFSFYANFNNRTVPTQQQSIGFGLTVNLDSRGDMMTGRVESIQRWCSVGC